MDILGLMHIEYASMANAVSGKGSIVRPTMLAALLVAPAALLFVRHLGEPYMDEIFHVPQVFHAPARF